MILFFFGKKTTTRKMVIAIPALILAFVIIVAIKQVAAVKYPRIFADLFFIPLIKIAAKTMLERKIGCVVVLEREKVVGIVTESDLVKCAASGHDPNRTLVKDIMRVKFPKVKDTDLLIKAQAVMEENQMRALPVMRDGAVAGIVTIEDIGRIYAMASQGVK